MPAQVTALVIVDVVKDKIVQYRTFELSNFYPGSIDIYKYNSVSEEKWVSMNSRLQSAPRETVPARMDAKNA